ncbi:MAG TPA: PrgI family protein [Candidatus Peribacteraceae bacterium]|nr:PrgI family protein [Candidatus Peribacteraceae bacterium]
MAIDPVKIPANVQVEEKIVGPVGLRQLFLLLGSGGFSYLIFSIMQKSGAPGTVQFFAWIPLVIGAAFAFVTVNDISLLKLIFLQIEKWDKPARRTFGPRRGIEVNIRTAIDDKKETPNKAELPGTAALTALSTTLDVGPVDVEDNIADGSITIGISEADGPSIDGFFEPETDTDDDEPPFLRDLSPPSHA